MTIRKRVIEQPATRVLSKKIEEQSKLLRVCAYARVSTDGDEQLSSYELQVRYYEKLINDNPEWQFIKVFADEGISGTNTRLREEFNEMIELCNKRKIDLIVTKSVSRFARNTVDCLQTCRMLKDIGVGVYFEKESINTLDERGELLLTILSSLAQEESRSISENVKWGIRKRFSEGSYKFNTNNFLGYRRTHDGNIEIIEEEAIVVRKVFELYLGGLSFQRVANQLNELGYKTIYGAEWQANSVAKVLKNEKYAGNVIFQKTYSSDYINKKHLINNGELPKYYVEDNHEAIIPQDVFILTQEEISKRSTRSGIKRRGRIDKAGRHSKYILSNFLVCEECGSNFRRASWTNYYEKKYVYRCASRMKHGTRFCGCSPTLDEQAVKSAVMQAISDVKGDDNLRDTLIENINSVINPFNDIEGNERMTKIKKNIDQYGLNFLEFDETLVNGLIDRIIVKENKKIVVHFKAGMSREIKIT